VHIAGFNFDLLIRHLNGYGTPKGATDAWNLIFLGVGMKTAEYGSPWRYMMTGRTKGCPWWSSVHGLAESELSQRPVILDMSSLPWLVYGHLN
jgi:hypothetical protein